jgi:hypothetical protein
MLKVWVLSLEVCSSDVEGINRGQWRGREEFMKSKEEVYQREE